MNTNTIKKKLQEWYDTATPEQVVKEFEEVYWLWYWGWDQNDLTQHSVKIKFTDFNEMKTFSSRHSFVCQHLKPNYWSKYEYIDSTITSNS